MATSNGPCRDTIQTANARIGRLVSYGLREFQTKANGYVISWSNASACWTRHYYMTRKGAIVHLDANQTIVYQTKAVVDKWIEDKQLKTLPLYCNSFEAVYLRGKRRGDE